MKKVLTFAVAVMMVVTMFGGIVLAEDGNGEFPTTGRNATYIATRFAPVGYTWSGTKLYADRQRTFEVGGTYTGFGRTGYLMPACTDSVATGAVSQPGGANTALYNIPATTEATSVEPRFWCEVYLTVRPEGPQSTEEDHWFVVVDSGGNVWFDPDGYFHDSRYYAYADPRDPRYNFDANSRFDHCTRNPKAAVDPIRSNNTQGPYPLLPTTEAGDVNPGYVDFFQANEGDTTPDPVTGVSVFPTTGLGSTPMYFMPPDLDGRLFRIGWVDMVDFPLVQGGADEDHPYNPAIDGALRETVVGGSHRADTWVTQASYWGIPADTFWQHRWDDWDFNMPLVRFRDGIDFGAPQGPDATFWALRTTDPQDAIPLTTPWDFDLQWGEEWHAENLAVDGVYAPGEWIYRAGWVHSQFTPASPFWDPATGAGTPPTDNFVMGYDPYAVGEAWVDGDLRLTPVSVHIKTAAAGTGGLAVQGGFTYNYAPGTVPIDRNGSGGVGGLAGSWDAGDDYDIGLMDMLDNVGDPNPDPNPRMLVPFVLSPGSFGMPDPGLLPTEDDEIHAENISARGVGISGVGLFDPYEHIYRKGYAITAGGNMPNTNPFVEFGDYRLSNVNANSHPWAVRNFEGSNQNALGGMWIGDVLILAEVLTAVCNDNDFYNLSVQTDLWEGMIPSQCSATIRSQVGEVVQRTQTINKSTVLGPTPTSFAVPATTFMDCYIGSRQYMGVEIFVDDGKDNNLGVQHYTNNDETPPDTERLLYNNLTDDYRPGRTGEKFLGAVDPAFGMANLTDLIITGLGAGDNDYYMQSMVGKDVGRKLTRLDQLTPPVKFRNRSTIAGGGFGDDGVYFGCGTPIYVDMNDNNEVDRGDVRMSDMKIVRSGAIIEYKAGSTVNVGDVDVNSNAGGNNDLHIFTFQQNLVGSPNSVWQFPMFYDDFTVDPNNPNVIIPPNGTYDVGEIIYNTKNAYYSGQVLDDVFVAAGTQRLTSGWVGDTFYECGSIVPAWDFWAYPSVPYGVTTGLNCDQRFMDWEVIPGNINLNVELNKPLMVEQTSDVRITVDPPPRPGHWRDLGDHRTWIPDEKIYVMVRENIGVDYRGWTEADASLNLYSTFRVLTPNAPEAVFTLTPYRGSCNAYPGEIGVDTEAQYRVQAFKMNPEIDIFANRTGKANVRIVPPDQHPGYHDPAADNPNLVRHETRHYYRDMFWTGDWYHIIGDSQPEWRHWNKIDRDYTPGYRVPGLSLPDEDKYYRDLAPSPPLPVILSEHYDCYGEFYAPVAPEDLEIEASVACITTLDQRFPNVLLKLNNWDNPNDVNDPYDIPFSVPNVNSEPGEAPLIATYNANGGGIEWLGVATLANPSVTHEKIIFQANTDGTYYYWYWYEPANTIPELGPQIMNAIDPNDWIIGEPWSDFTNACPVDMNREAIKVKDRSTWQDSDCSADVEYKYCDNDTLNMPIGMYPIGDITGNDKNALASDQYGMFDGAFGWISSYGVPTYVTPYGEITPSDEGGECLITLLPNDGSTHVKIHVYLTSAIFDYNSSQAHPFTGGPYFRFDNWNGVPQFNQNSMELGKGVSGIDYAGFIDLKVYQADPYVNFAEWLIVDKAIQYSNVNYTAGNTTNPALAALPPPAPQIQVPYWPILRTSHGGFRCYPGGQTHTGRVEGANFNQNGGAFGWNAYPAIWSETTQRNTKAEKFYKLGTEFFPLTDYGLYFILKDGEGNHLSFESDDVEKQLKRIVIEGPFARPKTVDVLTDSVLNKYCYNGLKHVPIQYDFSGKLVIDETNWGQYEHSPGGDFLNWSALGDVDYGTLENLYMVRTKRLNYCSLENVFVIDELIPWNYGKILIYVTLMDGTFKMYQDCCTSPPVDGIDVRALDIEQINAPGSSVKDDTYDFVDFLTLDQDNYLSFTLKEHEEIQVEQLCNDAVMFCWQDRGIRDIADPDGILRTGAGDGWITNCPTSSRAENYATQFRPDQDFNDDGFITFDALETEILGSYDMSANTWLSGVIDARTFQRNGGRYDFELSEANGCQINEVGLDFGGEMGECDLPDHIISDNETIPIYITAYKYGDDNNDRGFSPWWDFDPYYAGINSDGDYFRTRYSHEVYLAGQMAIPIEPFDDLIVTYLPNPLTAGITPELVDVNSPLTFIVKDENGKAIDLTKGIVDQYGESTVEEKNVWNFLFKDPHPDNQYYYGQEAMLPQYYFLRTDLHNYDYTRVNNRELYSARERDENNQCLDYITTGFEPIEFAADGEAGRYYFKGFCANDSNVWLKDEDHPDRDTWEDDHKMRVFVYTPDRRHRGYVDVQIENPKVDYEIVNTEDPTLQVFTVPGEPDFLMTAADNRIYKVRVTVQNAQGVLVKGVSKGVSVCGGGVKNTARFTPFTTRPASFDFMQLSCDHIPCCDVVFPHFGYDFNANSNIEWQNKELYSAGSFHLSPITNSCWNRQAVGEVYYNTVNEFYEYDHTWKIVNEGTTGMSVEWVNLMLPPPGNMGWGLGAIYNNPYWGGFLFTDIDRNGKLDYHDSLALDVNAQTEFYVFAEDTLYIGGLIGQNVYGNVQAESDIVGYPPYSDKTNPRYMWKRFRGGVTNDTTFFLDWEGIPLTVAPVSYPRIELFDAETDIELSKDLINVDNYDFVYRAPNHVIARLYPASREDVMLKEDARLYISGSKEETKDFGHTKNSLTYSDATETTFHVMPQGTGQSVLYLSYLARNKFYVADLDCCDDMDVKFNSPEWYCLRNIYHIDSAKGLDVIVQGAELAPMTETELTVIVTETGAGHPVAEATVYLEGPGIEATPKTTNAKGEVKIVVMPDASGRIFISVEHDDYIPGKTWIGIGTDNIPPILEVNPVAEYTNEPSLEVTGKTDPGVKVSINGVAAKVEKSGRFSAKIALKEGNNIIYVLAIDAGGNKVTHTMETILDTAKPNFIIDGEKDGKLVVASDTTKVVVTGRVDPYSSVTANGQPAKCPYDKWEVEIPMAQNLDTLKVKFEFVDKAGNVAVYEVTLTRE